MKKTVITLTLAAALALSGCGSAPSPAAQEVTPEVAAVTVKPDRENGERFEGSLSVLGMVETIHYEHIVNEALGLEMDYDYENFTRTSDAAGERFVSVWDDPARPENYIEVRAEAQSAEQVTEAVIAELSEDYELTQSTRTLDYAGECLRIEASVIKGTNRMPDQLQAVYIIPAPNGCLVATTHAFIVESEGFFKRCDDIIRTISPLE